MDKSSKTKGFTLAEVLVTLTIIGIVASMTIPSLLKDYEYSQNRSRTKAAYSFLTRAFIRMQADNTVPDFSASGSRIDFRDDFCNQIKCLKTGVMSDFFAPYYYYYQNNSSYEDYTGSLSPSAILNNGMIAVFYNELINCTQTYGSLNTVCAYMYIDTNAEKGPNMYGKDYLLFWITRENGNYQVLPAGSKDGHSCIAPAASPEESWGCTGYYIFNKELP